MLQDELEVARSAKNDVLRRLQSLEQDNAGSVVAASAYESQLQHLKEQIKSVREAAQQDKARLVTELQDATAARDQALGRSKSFEADVNVAAKQYKTKIQELTGQIETINEAAEDGRNSLLAQLEKIEQEKLDAEARVRTLQNDLKAQVVQIEEHRDAHAKLGSELEASAATIASFGQKVC